MSQAQWFQTVALEECSDEYMEELNELLNELLAKEKENDAFIVR